jgi:hypothetical protein
MSKPDFKTMSRAELRKYVLEHREDNEAFQTYVDKFTNSDTILFPAPQSIEDLANYPELYRENQERLRKEAN